MYHEPLNISM